MEALEVLGSMKSFASLSEADRQALSTAMQVRDYPDGHTFIREGARADAAYLVLEGEVRVTRDRRGTVEDLNRLGKGAFFGLVALVDEGPRSATCRAAGPVRVASLPPSAFALLFNAHAPIALAIQRVVAEQLTRDFRNLRQSIRVRAV
jgi:putative ABC transport system ATP-binding protein